MLRVNQLIGSGSGRRNTGPIGLVGYKSIGIQGQTVSDTSVSLTSGLTGGSRAYAQEGDYIVAAQNMSQISNSKNPYIHDGVSAYPTLAFVTPSRTKLLVGGKFYDGEGNVVFTKSDTNDESSAASVYVFSGVDFDNPIDVPVLTASSSNSSYPNPPAITPAMAGAWIVCIGGNGNQGSGNDSFSSPADLTNFTTAYYNDLYGDTAIGVGLKKDWASGSFDPSSWTLSPQGNSSNDSWAAVSLALKRA